MPTALDNYNKLQDFMSKQKGQTYTPAQSWTETANKQTAPPAVQQQVQAPTAYDPTENINLLRDMQNQQAISALKKSRNNALSNIKAEKATIAPAFYNKRNETATGSQLQAKNFAEFMANRGGTNSGTNAQAEISRNVALQGNIGALNQQEAQAFSDIARRETDVKNAYENDVISAQAGIEAQAMQQLISAQQRAYENSLNQYNVDRNFNYQSGRDTVLDNRYNQQFNYQTGRDKVLDDRYNAEYADRRNDVQYERDYRTGRDTIDDSWRNKTFDYQKSQDDFSRSLQLQELELARQKATQTGSSTPFQQMTPTQQRKSLEEQAWTEYGTALNSSLDEAKNYLQANYEDIVAALGENGFKELWDDLINRYKKNEVSRYYATNPADINAAKAGNVTRKPVIMAN